jgi:hypothetical protein
MISQGDLQGRLRLFRYGLIVLVIVTFLVSLLAPYAIAAPYAAEINRLCDAARAAGTSDCSPQTVNITDFIGNAVLYTVVVGVIAVIIYFVYAQVINRSATPAAK